MNEEHVKTADVEKGEGSRQTNDWSNGVVEWWSNGRVWLKV